MQNIDCPIRILQINAGNRDFGGVSSFLYNVYSSIDRQYVQFDFLSPNHTTYHEHRDNIQSMGGKVYEFRIKGTGVLPKLKFAKRLVSFIYEKGYRTVQINSGSFFFNILASIAAKMSGAKNVIVHSHSVLADNASIFKRIIIWITKPIFLMTATNYFACSSDAAKFMFPKIILRQVKIIHSGLIVHKFEFSSLSRREIRNELNIHEEFVIGHVGRFDRVKNQAFILQILKILISKGYRVKLVLVGEGETLSYIKQKVREYDIEENVIFAGLRKDVERFYSAFDYYVFPSLYEGLGMSLVEAQISGLKCLASSGVPKDTRISDNVEYMSIDSNAKEWASHIEIIINTEKKAEVRQSFALEAINKGYNIDSIANNLQNFYIEKDTDGKWRS